MQNERLFDKIRETALSDTTGTDEYNPEQLWSRIQEKQETKYRVLWWPFAAAAAILLLFALLYLPSNEKAQVANQVQRKDQVNERPEKHSKKRAQNLPKDTASPAPTIARVYKKPVLDNFTRRETANSHNFTSPVTSEPDNLIAPESEIRILKDSMPNQTETKPDPATKSEKVLVASIALPDDEPVEQQGLQRIFEQVKKDREARKMRLHFHRYAGKLTLWSFVHQSFVEIPAPNIKPEQRGESH